MSEEIKDVSEMTETAEVAKTVEEDVMELLGAFLQQEIGNKITQFNMQGLSQLLLAVISKGT